MVICQHYGFNLGNRFIAVGFRDREISMTILVKSREREREREFNHLDLVITISLQSGRSQSTSDNQFSPNQPTVGRKAGLN